MEWVTSWGMFWVSVAIAIAGFAALHLNARLLAAHTDPEVILYTANDESRPSVILLIIENVGRGMAYDVRLSSSDPIPCKVWGVTEKSAEPPKGFNLGPLQAGIPALGPGSKRVMAWGQYAALSKFLGDRTIEVTITYSSRGPLSGSPSEHVTRCPLEVFSYDHTDAVDPDGARQSAKQLERIAGTLGLFARRLPPERKQTPEEMKAILELIRATYEAAQPEESHEPSASSASTRIVVP